MTKPHPIKPVPQQRGGYDWSAPRILVTGGASFIGSHLVDGLLARGARHIRVVDDLTSGREENILGHLSSGMARLVRADLLEPGVAEQSVQDIDVVFHLAAIHGGRGFVDLHPAACAQNFALDGALIRAAHRAKVSKFVFASSGCVYPNHLQRKPDEELFLTEEMVGPPYDADNTYGWAKLMAETTLRAYYRDWGFRSASCRFFTVYGERGVENHAVMAMIARAFVRQDPFEVWGDGTQVRNWTYVGDIVEGMILSAEKIDDGTAVNLGTEERIRVSDAVRMVTRLAGYEPKIKLLRDMPTGPLNRVARNRLAKELLGWTPKTAFADGLRRTQEWYFKTHRRDDVNLRLAEKLTER